MTKEEVLQLLRAGGYVSGEQISRQFGVSRAAVWKLIASLRQEGYQIDSVTNRGYCLRQEPDRLTQERICALLGEHPWSGLVRVYGEVDSTNTVAKQLAAEGAPEGTVVIADSQTAGRGRMGRSFFSPPGQSVFISVILRPSLPPTELTHLTAVSALAVCDTIEATCGLQAGIKWTNDVIYDGHKLCGILTELSIEAETGAVQYAVVGIGFNCNQRSEDFPPELRQIAASIYGCTGRPVDRCALAAQAVIELERLRSGLTDKREALSRYAARCVTLGKDVRIVRGDEERLAHALDIDENAALLVEYPDGSRGVVNTGEVSVRGMYGYV